MKKIGLKYCGGCNPRYNRVALVQYIERRCAGVLEFVDPHTDGIDFILAVHGCEVSCANLEFSAGIPVRHVSGIGDAEEFIDEILQDDNTGLTDKDG